MNLLFTIIYLFTFFYRFIKAALVCDSYSCDPKLFTYQNTCFMSKYNSFYNSSDIFVNSCSENHSKCQYSKRALGQVNDMKFACQSISLPPSANEKNVPLELAIKVPNYSLLDGEMCSQDIDCYNGLTCNINSKDNFYYCTTSKNVGSSCIANEECGSKDYCAISSKTCQTRKKENETCSINDECQNLLNCYQGNCTLLFSKLPGTIMQPADYKLCNSSFVYDNKCQDYYLIDDKQERAFTVDCTQTDLCTYFLPLKNDIIHLSSKTGHCNCGFNKDRKAYCSHGSNSFSMYQLINLEIKILENNCHISKKLTCNKITQKNLLNYQFLKNALSGKLQKVERCMALFISKSYSLVLNFILLAIFIIILL